MQTPRPAYNAQLNQPGQTGQPIYAAQVPNHGNRLPGIYPSPAQQHQPSPPVSMNHPPNNVPSASGSMIQNAPNQPGHSQFSHGPVTPRPNFIQHQPQSGQPPRQMMHNSGGNPGMSAPTNFINQNYPQIPQQPMAQYPHNPHVIQLTNPNIGTLGQFTSGQAMMHGFMPQTMGYGVRPPFPNTGPNIYFSNSPYLTSSYTQQMMAPQQGMSQNQNQVANAPRPQQTQFQHQSASNASNAAPKPRQRRVLPIIDPSTGKNVLDDMTGPGSSSTSPSIASESASATVPTSNATSTGDNSSKKQQDSTELPLKDESKDSLPQSQPQQTPATQPQPQQPPQQQQQQQQPKSHHQQQIPSATVVVDVKTSESVARKSTSNVKAEATTASETNSSSNSGSDIKPASESVVRPGPPQSESTPTVTTESKVESVIESTTKPVIISSENETPKEIQQPKITPAESSEVSKPGVTKYSPSADKASPTKVATPVPVVIESSGQATQHQAVVDDIQKKSTEVSLNGDIDEVESDVLSPSANDALKSESDSKSLKSQSPIQAPEPLSASPPVDGDDKMQYNINGKYRYTRDQLFKLRDCPSCQEAPSLAPNIWDTLKATTKVNAPRMDFGTDMFYPFGPPSSAPRNPMPPRTGAYIGRCSLDSRTSTKKVIPAPPLPQDVKLHTTENAWKPELKKKTASDLDEEAKTAELLKTFRGYLNKITPQKYDVIEGKIQGLTIDTEERLSIILNLIFDKAVDEPAFCIQYANLCKYLNNLKVTKTNDKGVEEVVGFWRLLLTKCQQQFERDIYADIDIDSRVKAIAECTDTDKKRLLESEFDEEKRRARKKSLGNMKLIGELYRLDMLNVKIMISCVQRLLSPIEEENIECLCTLLRTIGPKLSDDCRVKDKDKALDMLFAQLTSIAEDIKHKRGEAAKLSSRVRFLILDILDMRKNDWQERTIQKEDRPKTIQEIHAEVQAAEEKQQMEHLQYSQNRDRRKNHTDNSYARKSQQGPSRDTNTKETLASVINIFKQNQNESSKQLAPASLSTNFAKWSQGSGAHTQSGNTSSSTSSSIGGHSATAAPATTAPPPPPSSAAPTTAAAAVAAAAAPVVATPPPPPAPPRPSQEQKEELVTKAESGEKKSAEGAS